MRHLLTHVVEPNRADRRTIAQVINEAIEANEQRQVNRLLASYGLKIKEERQPGPTPAYFLAVAGNHAGLMKVFENTHWSGGASQSTVYTQSLRRLPLASRPEHPLSIGGVNMRVTLLPLSGSDSILPGSIDGP